MDKEVDEFLGQEESSCCLIWPDYSNNETRKNYLEGKTAIPTNFQL